MSYGIHDPEPESVTPEDRVYGWAATAYAVKHKEGVAEVSFRCTVGGKDVTGTIRLTRNGEDWISQPNPELDLILFGFQVAEIGTEAEVFVHELERDLAETISQ